MAAKYRKIDPRIWRDEKFRRLGESDKLLTLYILASSQVNRLGIFPFSVGMAAEELGDNPETCARRLRAVCKTFSWQWDDVARVVYLPTWWKYNPPENQFVMKGNMADLHDLPDSPLLDLFFSNTAYLTGGALACFEDTSSRRLPRRLPRRGGVQEQEQEQEQEEEFTAVGGPTDDGKASHASPDATGEKPPRKAKPTTAKAPRARCPVWDAIVEVTGVEQETNASRIGKLKSQLLKAEPPYTGEEIKTFGERFWDLCKWAAEDGRAKPTLGELSNHIGLVRSSPNPTAPQKRRGAESVEDKARRMLGNAFTTDDNSEALEN